MANEMKIVLTAIAPRYSGSPLAPYLLRSYAYKDKILGKKSRIGVHCYFTEHDNDYIIKKLLNADPEIIGFSTYVWNINKILEISREIKKIKKSVTIILGGPEATGLKERLLVNNNLDIDVIVLGEGEVTFSELVKQMVFNRGKDKHFLKDIFGIAFYDSGKVITTKERPYLENLSEIPSTYLDDKDAMRYVLDRSFRIETSRGCPFRCIYCGWSTKGKIRYFPLERTIKEIRYLLKKPEVHYLHFTDSNLFSDPARSRAILETLSKFNLSSKSPKRVICSVLADNFDYDLIDYLKKIPLNTLILQIAIQSINPGVLKVAKRNFDISKAKQLAMEIHKNLLNPCIFLDVMFGLPGDTLTSFKETLNFALSLKPRHISISHTLALPNSELYINRDRYDIKFQEDAPHRIIETKTFSKDELNVARKITVYLSSLLLKMSLIKDMNYYLADKSDKNFFSLYEGFIEYLEKDCLIKSIFPNMPNFEEDELKTCSETTINSEVSFGLIKSFFEYLKKIDKITNFSQLFLDEQIRFYELKHLMEKEAYRFERIYVPRSFRGIYKFLTPQLSANLKLEVFQSEIFRPKFGKEDIKRIYVVFEKTKNEALAVEIDEISYNFLKMCSGKKTITEIISYSYNQPNFPQKNYLQYIELFQLFLERQYIIVRPNSSISKLYLEAENIFLSGFKYIKVILDLLRQGRISLLVYKIKTRLERNRFGKNILRLLRIFLRPIRALRTRLKRLLSRVDGLYLEVTYACNLRCIVCYAKAGLKKQNELTLEEKKSVIGQAKKMGARSVFLCGSGEPLLYKDIFTFIDYTRQLGMHVTISTNGIVLTKEVADFLISRKVAVLFKLWSLNPDVFDRMVGVKNAYKWVDYFYKYNGAVKAVKIPSGLKHLLDVCSIQKRKDLVIIETLVTRINYSTLPEVARFCSEMNIYPWYLETPIFQGRAIDNYNDIGLDRDEYRNLYRELVGITGEDYLKEHRNMSCSIERNPVVWTNGEIGFCCCRKAHIGNVRNVPLKLLFSKAVQLKRREDRLIAKRKVVSKFFRSCRGRQYYELKHGIPCNY